MSSWTLMASGKGREPMSRGAVILLLVLFCGAVFGNCLKLPLYLKMDMLFGSIFTMIAIQLFGRRWGILTALISSTSAWFMFGHYFSGINFILEAVVVSSLYSRRGKGLVFFSSLYWICLGMPLAWLYFHNFSSVTSDLALLITFKQGINGIFNTLAAKLIVILFPLSDRLARITGKRQVTLQQILSTVLAVCVLFPLLGLTSLSIREGYKDELYNFTQELTHVANHSSWAVQTWLSERLSDITSLVQMQSSLEVLRGKQKQILELDRNILKIGLFDRRGTSIAFDPPVDTISGKLNIDISLVDEPRLQAVKLTKKPIISAVIIGGSARQSPIVIVDAPIHAGEEFAGFVSGALNLQGISDLLAQIAKDWSCKAVLLDKDRRIIASSEATWPLLQQFERKNGRMVAIDSSTSQWVPRGKSGAKSSQQWRDSYFLQELPIGHGTSWKLVVEMPFTPRLHYLNRLYTKELFFMLVWIVLTLCFANLIGKRLTWALTKLRETTTGLPDAISRQREIDWPSSLIAEVTSLITNFKIVTGSLSGKFDELTATNQALAIENRERRLAEERLGEATTELIAIFQAFPDLCLVVDAGATILDCRGGIMPELPLCAQEVRGQRLTDIFPDNIASQYLTAIGAVLVSRTIKSFDYWISGDKGENFYEARLVPLSSQQLIIIVRNVTELKRAEELRLSNEQLRNLSIHLEEVRENERALIAREIHDELGQQLTGLRFDLGWIGKRLPAGESELSARIGTMAQLVDRTIKTVRRIAMELRPRMLDDLGLVAAMEWQVSEFQERTAIPCQFRVSSSELVVEQRRATAVFRILQEALTNIIRHSEATRVDVFLSESNGMLVLKIVDNGKGISKNAVRGKASFGIMGMHERAREWGGSVTFTGQPGHGTNILVVIPLEEKGGE